MGNAEREKLKILLNHWIEHSKEPRLQGGALKTLKQF
jgi:hypothetical protein